MKKNDAIVYRDPSGILHDGFVENILYPRNGTGNWVVIKYYVSRYGWVTARFPMRMANNILSVKGVNNDFQKTK